MISAIKDEWSRFKDDPPGQRFERHRERLQHQSRSLMIAQVGLGIVLLLAGIAMLFAPGPGILAIAFGIGLVAGVSRRISALLDRAEPPARRRAAAMQQRWRDASATVKVAVVTSAVALAALGAYLAWRWLAG